MYKNAKDNIGFYEKKSIRRNSSTTVAFSPFTTARIRFSEFCRVVKSLRGLKKYTQNSN